MTNDQQDINSEDLEQQEAKEPVKKFKTKKTSNNIFDTVIFFIILFITVLIIGNTIFVSESFDYYEYERNEGQQLLDSLQSAAAVYVAQQRVIPEKFSDFVTPNYPMADYAVLTLNNIDAKFEGIDTTQLKRIYYEDEFATYYLNGTDVTLKYSFEEKEIKQQQEQEERERQERIPKVILFFILVLCITYGCYFLYKLIKQTIFGKIILGLLICWFLFNVVNPPRFSSLKPAIYLYPTKPTNINVTIDKNIDLTLDIPKYQPDKGWNVLAYPDGKIVDLQPQYTICNDLDTSRFGMEYAKDACIQNNYPYLYWEGIPNNKPLPQQTNGWIVKTANIKAFLESKLDYVGFNKAEKDEFVRYWSHKIAEGKQDTVFVSFMQTEAVNNDNSLTITPTPDSLNRFYIVVDFNVKNHKNPAEQVLTKFKRTGFTVVDWGGCVIDL